MTKRDIFRSAITILVCLFILTGCTLIHRLDEKKSIQPVIDENTKTVEPVGNADSVKQATISEKLAAQSKVKKFTNMDELKSFLEENDNSYVNNYYAEDMVSMRSFSGSRMDAAMPTAGISKGVSNSLGVKENAAKDNTAETAAVSQAERDYSKTNVQVAGVDEADIIKSDGTYIYTVSRNNLFIIKAYPSESVEILSKIEFKSRPLDIYINGNQLVVYGQDDQIYTSDIYKKFKRRNSYTFFKVFDVADKKNPKQIKDLDFEGNYNDSRMIGDYVYFVTSNYNYSYLDDGTILPRILEDGKVATDNCASSTEVKCVMPDVYYFNIPYDAYNFTTISAINVKDVSEKPSSQIYVMSSNQNMYVSQNNIYITYTKYISEYELEMEVMREMVYPRLSKIDQERIDKIEAAENYILSAQEKKDKISQIISRFGESLSDEEQANIENELSAKMKDKYKNISEELEKTVVHKIAVDKNKLEYKNFGEVTGQVLNQFSMDESDGYFRIATTKNQSWSQYEDAGVQQSYNNIFVLDADMKIVGSLKNVASGEKIYSVRFMQNRAYMVTFKQTDPLFVIDLADPKNPAILGQLKIPGFSSYLHPYDATTLIGIGKETTENKWGGVTTKGIKLSLFDVAKVDAPKEIGNYVLGDAGSDSIALSDHKAFLFSKDKNLLVIPVSINEVTGQNQWGKLVFSGAAVFQVDKAGFKLKGKIDHSKNGISAPVDYWNGYNYYDNTVKRSLYIENVLYTFSNNFLKMNDLTDLKSIKDLELVKEKTGPKDDYNIIN